MQLSKTLFRPWVLEKSSFFKPTGPSHRIHSQPTTYMLCNRLVSYTCGFETWAEFFSLECSQRLRIMQDWVPRKRLKLRTDHKLQRISGLKQGGGSELWCYSGSQNWLLRMEFVSQVRSWLVFPRNHTNRLSICFHWRTRRWAKFQKVNSR